jgi:hypothetical protein
VRFGRGRRPVLHDAALHEMAAVEEAPVIAADIELAARTESTG